MATILLVEDSPTDAHAYGKQLRAEGHVVHHATDGAEGCEIARACRPDLILMDIVMPRVNGFEATRTLQGEAATRHIPVIMLSTKGQETDRIWGLRQGARDYLVKPVPARVLLRCVDSALTDV